MHKKEWEIINSNEWYLDQWVDAKNHLPFYYDKILKILHNYDKFKNDIECFYKFRESKPTVSEATLENFAKKYIRIIEAFWEIFFRDILKVTYKNVRIEVIDEAQLLQKYKNVWWSLFYQPIWNIVVIVKDRFFKDFEFILKWDAWIILAFAHEIWHAVQAQYEKIFWEYNFDEIKYKWWKHVEDSLEFIETVLESINANIRLNENKADFYAWVCARILYEVWVFNEEDLKNWETSFYFLWAFWCIDTHWTSEERLQMFSDWYKAWWKYVYLIQQKS